MQRDKIYGLLVFIVVITALIYLSLGYITQLVTLAGENIFPPWDQIIFHVVPGLVPKIYGFIPHWSFFVILPMWIAVSIILIIMMRIGWQKMTAKPEIPLEDIEDTNFKVKIKKKKSKI
ncbi:MAG: hypothetical protein ACTSRW_08290 [Candidatus Helarchaeota archaeon]